MGKFKLEYESQFDNYPEWKKDFIKYSEAKQLIKTIKHDFTRDSDVNAIEFNFPLIEGEGRREIEKKEKDSYVTSHTKSLESIHIQYHTFLNQKEDLEALYQLEQGNIIHDLFNSIDKDIDNLYFFYYTEERALHVKLNSQLRVIINTPNISLFLLSSEMSKLRNLLLRTASLCTFLDLNMKCLRRICYQIDKHLKRLYKRGSISLKYLREKLTNPDSNLNYVLQYKLIDEVSAIGDYLNQMIVDDSKEIKKGKDLKNRLIVTNISLSSYSAKPSPRQSFRSKCSQKKDLEQGNMEASLLAEEDREKLIEINNSISSKEDENTMYDRLQAKIKECSDSIESSIRKIDEGDHFRVKFKNFCLSIRYGYKAIGKNQYLTGIKLEEEDNNVIINCLMDEELIIKQFVPKRGLLEYLRYYEECLSEKNKRNIKLMLAHTFVLNILYPISIFPPFFIPLLTARFQYLKEFFLTVCGLHFGLLISNFLYGTILSKSRHYKWCFYLSSFILIIGLCLYEAINLIAREFYLQHQFLIGLIEKIIFGIGMSQLISRKYLVTYSSRPLIRKTIEKYHFYNDLGIMLGFFVSGIIATLQTLQDKINVLFYSFGYFNIPALVCVMIFLQAIIVYFTDPTDEIFSINATFLVENIGDEQAKEVLKSISTHQKESITIANKELEDDNLKSQYTTTNFIQMTVQEIIQQEKGFCSYQRLSFLGLLLVAFFNQLLPEICFLFLFILKSNETDLDKKRRPIRLSIRFVFPFFCFYYAIASLLHYIVEYKTKMKFTERYCIAILVGIIAVLVNALLIIPYEDNSIPLFVMGSLAWLIIVFCHCLITHQCTRLLKKIVPQEFNLCGFNVSFYISELEYVAKIVAYLVLYCFLEIVGQHKTHFGEFDESIIRKTYYCFISIIGIEFIIAVGFLKYLRLKAIARILKKNLY